MELHHWKNQRSKGDSVANIENLLSELTNLLECLNYEQEQVVEEINGLQEQIDELNNNIEGHMGTIDILENRVESLEESVNKKITIIEELEEANAALTYDNDELKAKLNTTE